MILFIFTILLHSYQSISPKDTNLKAVSVLKQKDIIWGLDFVNKDKVLITLKKGELKYIDLKTKKTISTFTVPNLSSAGQGGLLDVKVHYNYPKNPYVFFTYSLEKEDNKTTALARLTLKNNKFQDFKILYEAKPYFDEDHHFGSRLVFDEKGYIFFSVGDRGNRDLAQKLNTANGKIHRIKEDGSIPKDNPFYDKKEAIKSIWSYGHRNPQGLFYDKKTGDLWEQEHGPRGGDEINLIKKADNYGWPVITYGKEYWGPSIGEGTKKKGMEQPYYHYTPSIAPSGFVFYQGSRYREWKNRFLSGALKLQHINSLKITKEKKMGDEKRYFEHLDKRIRALRISPDDYIYFTTDNGDLMKVTVQ